MTARDAPRLLILETSGRVGQVAVAAGPLLLQLRSLDEARRHARDLAPTVATLLAEQNWKPRDLQAVIVSRGPGSYTGLRVGIMSAKTLAYATGCALIAIDTFAAVALQSPDEAQTVDVLADAQQDKLYWQRFACAGTAWRPAAELQIMAATDWLKQRDASAWVTGAGLRVLGDRLSTDSRVVAAERWEPKVESLLQLGLARYQAGQRDDPWILEPLYARASSAEEKFKR